MTNMQGSAAKSFVLLCENYLTLLRVPSTKYVEEVKEQYQSFIKHVVTEEFEKFESFDKFKQELMNFSVLFYLKKSIVIFMTF